MSSSYPFFDKPPPGTPTAPPKPPTRLSPGAMFSESPSRPPAPCNKPQHRHSAAVDRAMTLLKHETTFGKGKGKARDQGIIADLEQMGWAHQSTTDSIRIFSRPSDARSGAAATEREGTFVSQRSAGAGLGRTERKQQVGGIRHDEDLPWFRGEGWIEGQWQLEDIAQTLVSAGARSVWDPRYDPTNSGVVALLSPTDQLSCMHIRAELGADRDACLVSSIDLDEERKVCYVASTSVEDPLVPVAGVRTNIHLNGYCLRALPRSPHFEPPPDKTSVEAPAPVRPGHRRLKSSMSISGPMSPTYLAPSLPTLPDSGFPFQPRTPGVAGFAAPFSPPPMGARLPSDDDDSRRDGESEINPFDVPQFTAPTLPKPKPPPLIELAAPSTEPGVACSFIVHVSPGFNLPQTTVNQLSVHLPLSIAALGRFLSVYGFCPYVVQRPRGLEIMDEKFEAVRGFYRVVYRVTSDTGEPDTRIRFFGGTFAKGRFDVEVEGVEQDWRLEYDVEPDADNRPILRRKEDDSEVPRPRQSRKSSLSVLASPLMASTPFPADSPSSSSDPARLPGPLGGCTLLIPNSSTLHQPITITISKNAEAQARPLNRMQRMSRALGRAIRKSEAGHSQFDTVEELLERSAGDGRAELCLRGAREALMEMRRAKEEEREDDQAVAIELAEELGHHPRSLEIDEQARIRRRSLGLGLEGIH